MLISGSFPRNFVITELVPEDNGAHPVVGHQGALHDLVKHKVVVLSFWDDLNFNFLYMFLTIWKVNVTHRSNLSVFRFNNCIATQPSCSSPIHLLIDQTVLLIELMRDVADVNLAPVLLVWVEGDLGHLTINCFGWYGQNSRLESLWFSVHLSESHKLVLQS